MINRISVFFILAFLTIICLEICDAHQVDGKWHRNEVSSHFHLPSNKQYCEETGAFWACELAAGRPHPAERSTPSSPENPASADTQPEAPAEESSVGNSANDGTEQTDTTATSVQSLQTPVAAEATQTPTPGLEVGETSIQSLQKKGVYVSLPPQPQKPLCQNDMPTATAIRITNVIHEKHPKRLIITFENASSRYIQFKDPFLRIAIISKDLKIRAVSEVKNRNTYGSTLLFALRNKKKTVKTAGIFTLGWHIRKKTIDYRADKNMYGALFATELRYYIPKTGETLYDTENDSIVILYNCDSRHTFNALKIGDTVQREHIIAEYPPPEAEAAPAAPSLFVRKAATTWGHLKRLPEK